MTEKTNYLGQLLSSPLKALNLPFKVRRQLYGEPRVGETYTGTIIQKQRLKRVIPLINSGEELNKPDKLFMNMFNDFLTGEGHEALDQKDIKLTCVDCEPYIYRPFSQGKRYSEPRTEKSLGSSFNELVKGKSYRIKFNDELEPSNPKNKFQEDNTYTLTFLGFVDNTSSLDLKFRNGFLQDDDYLIFRTRDRKPINVFKNFEVYQNNLTNPLRRDLNLKRINAKIYSV